MLFLKWLHKNYKNPESCVIVSPDAGGVKRVTAVADRFKTGFAIFHRGRSEKNKIVRDAVVGHVKGKACVILDDLADTCETLVTAAQALKNSEAASVIAIVTHGLFSPNSIERIEKSAIDKGYNFPDILSFQSLKFKINDLRFEYLCIRQTHCDQYSTSSRKSFKGEDDIKPLCHR